MSNHVYLNRLYHTTQILEQISTEVKSCPLILSTKRIIVLFFLMLTSYSYYPATVPKHNRQKCGIYFQQYHRI